MEYNRWYRITLLKEGYSLKIFYDGGEVASRTLSGESYSNTGPLYIGKDPWYKGITGGGYDNIQIHNRALTGDEIDQVGVYGAIIIDSSTALAIDFAEPVTEDGKVKELSVHETNAGVVGTPGMTEGG